MIELTREFKDKKFTIGYNSITVDDGQSHVTMEIEHVEFMAKLMRVFDEMSKLEEGLE